MGKYLLIAIRNLTKHRTRSLIIGSAILFATTIMTLLMSLIAGIEQTILESGSALTSGHINVAGFYKISQSSAAPVIKNYQEIRQITEAAVPDAKIIIDRVKAYGKIISDTNSIMVPIWGVKISQESQILGKLPLACTRDYLNQPATETATCDTEGNINDLGKSGHIVIFASQAKKLGVKVGDMVTISMPTYRNINNTKDAKVAAVLKDMGLLSAFSSFLNATDTCELYNMDEATVTGQIMLYLNNIADVPRIEQQLRQTFADRGYSLMDKEAQPFWLKFDRISGESWVGQKLDITTWQDEMSFIKWILDIFNALTFSLITVLMIIIVMGLMNTLWIAIRERTAEVGTLRAIGMQRSGVIIMFMAESALLTLITAACGVLTGILLAYLINLQTIPLTSDTLRVFLMSDHLHFAIVSYNLLVTFMFVVCFALLGAIYPAYRASRLKPITAINYIN